MAEQNKTRKNTTRAAVGGFVILALATASFFYIQSKTGPGQPIPPDDASQSGDGAPTPEPTPGMTITLSDGNAAPETVELLPVTRGTPLTDTETDAILVRLPLLTSLPGDRVDFKLPEEVLPPPRTGDIIAHRIR